MNFSRQLYRSGVRQRLAITILCFGALAICLGGCASKPTDMRTLVPADSLVYLEVNDMADALRPIVEHQAFAGVPNKIDLSHLRGIQLAVTISGFELSEEKLTEEHSVGSVQPRFVAIADTHAWNWQALAFAERQMGAFVTDVYQSDVVQEKSDRYDGTFFSWQTNDGQQAFALVLGSFVYFGNDESAIEKCLAVKRGELDSIAKSGKVFSYDVATLARGYVSSDGMAQIASLIGLTIASRAGGEAEVQSAIASILPQLIRGVAKEINWSAISSNGRVQDNFIVASPDDTARVLAETLAPAPAATDTSLVSNVPVGVPSVSQYNLARPNIAWRSVLLTTQALTDPLSGKLIEELSSSLAGPYGIGDPELFLTGVAPVLITGDLDPSVSKPFVIAVVTSDEAVRRSLLGDLKPDRGLSSELGVEALTTHDGDLAAAFFDNQLIAGDREAVIACLRERAGGNVMVKSPPLPPIFAGGATVVTMARDSETAALIASVLFDAPQNSLSVASTNFTETRFNRNGITRRTTSDFGFIGWIITQLVGS